MSVLPALSACRREGHPPSVNVRCGVDYDIDASRAVRLLEGEHPPSVNVRRDVDNNVNASHAVHVPEGEHTPRVMACRGVD